MRWLILVLILVVALIIPGVVGQSIHQRATIQLNTPDPKAVVRMIRQRLCAGGSDGHGRRACAAAEAGD